MKRILFLFIIQFLFLQSSTAELVINEAMVNEPENFSSLEWIELYNSSFQEVQLSDYILIVDADSYRLPDVSIPERGYIILCRKLISDYSSTSFESFWGNNSMVWGDSEYEQTFIHPVELSFSLKNSNGEIRLLKNNSLISTFYWSESGIDGCSWERKEVRSDSIFQSSARKKATPGKVNSVSLVERDISIDSITITAQSGNPSVSVTVTNRGYETISDAFLLFSWSYDEYQLPEIASDTSYTLESTLSVKTGVMYYTDTVRISIIPEDDRPENDSLTYMAVGSLFPPIVVTEFLANPSGVKSSEWIELYNRSEMAIDLAGWHIGDSISLHTITDESHIVLPGEFVLLVESANDFYEQYLSILPHVTTIEPNSWAKLNNEYDKVRLIDSFGITASSYSYQQLYPDNYTVSRKSMDLNSSWGRSAVKYGSPGEVNSLFVPLDIPVIKITLNSQYIDRQSSGIDSQVRINLSLPEASAYTVKIYDRQGRVVKIFYQSAKQIETELYWDGSADVNGQLPVGIYILYVEAENLVHAKEVIVIAR